MNLDHVPTELTPKLNARQHAALTHIMEEAAEIIKCCTKIQRFGFHDEVPQIIEGLEVIVEYDNLGHLIDELKDLKLAVDHLHDAM